MTFDMLCAIAERHLPKMVSILQQARLFVFPGRAHEVLPKEISDEELEFLREYFFLPFPKVAVEDTATCVMLWDKDKEQCGIGTPRYFIDCLSLAAPIDEFDRTRDEDALFRQFEDIRRDNPPDTCCVTLGEITDVKTTREAIFIGGKVHWCVAANKHEVFATITRDSIAPDAFKEIERSALINARVALSEVFYFNNPSRFVVSKTRLDRKQVTGKTKWGTPRLARSINRSQYTLLAPAEIRETLGFPTPTGTKTAPHERRRHFRTFKDDRYVNMKGKTIVVPATWVGPEEAVVDGHRWKVMLDL